MDLTFLLVADALGLIVATIVLTYFFIKDILDNTNKKD